MFVTINISLDYTVATMHVSTQIICVVILVSYGVMTSQTPVEKVGVDPIPIEDSAVIVQKNCTSGFGLAGGCVERTYCDYGTPGIDFTSYAKRGYQKTCGDKEVCCPFSAQLPITPKKKTPDYNNFDFDDDD